jgi:aspartate 1-decarboxylase
LCAARRTGSGPAASEEEEAMYRQMLRAKVHRVTVTEADLDYEGSLTLDRDLMDAAGLVPHERVDVYNITRGTRLSTYVIEGRVGSRCCCVNGAAAHLAGVGDRLIVAAYTMVPEPEVRCHRPTIVLVDEDNRIRELKRGEIEGAKVS